MYTKYQSNTCGWIKIIFVVICWRSSRFCKVARLQSLLHDIELFCNVWRLRINTSKTKVMIFEKGRHTLKDFYLYGNKLEVVNSFKYLGINFFKNGSWFRSQKAVASHGSFALNRLFSIFGKVELPVSQKIKLFDTLVSSILHFGSEVFGTYECKDLELIHTKFLRRTRGDPKIRGLFLYLQNYLCYVFRTCTQQNSKYLE